MRSAIRTLIVDDEPVARRVLCEELEEIRETAVVGEAESGPVALEQIAALRPDLVFLDLQMPGMGGFEVIRRLTGPHLPVIVIVTAYQQHAREAFDAGAADYLLKPASLERLQKAIARAKNLIGRPKEIAAGLARIASGSEPSATSVRRKLVGRVGRDYFLLDMNDVVSLQAEGELVWIVTGQRRFLGGQSLSAIEGKLGPSFQRVHRNAIVNLNHIRTLAALTSGRWLVTLTNRQQLVVSKRRARYVHNLLRE